MIKTFLTDYCNVAITAIYMCYFVFLSFFLVVPLHTSEYFSPDISSSNLSSSLPAMPSKLITFAHPKTLDWLYEKYQIKTFFDQIRFSERSFTPQEYTSLIDHAKQGDLISTIILSKSLYPYFSRPSQSLVSLDSFKSILYEKSFLFSIIHRSPKLLQYLPPTLPFYRKLVLTVIEDHPSILQEIPHYFLNDKILIQKALLKKPSLYLLISPTLKQDKDIALIAIQQSGWIIKNVPDSLKHDKDLVLAAAKTWGNVLLNTAPSFRNDPDVVKAALLSNKTDIVIQIIDPILKSNPSLMLTAVTHYWKNYLHLSSTLQLDLEIVLAAIQQFPKAIQFVPASLQDNFEIVQAALKQDGFALQYASPRLRAQKDCVLLAITQKGFALQYANPKLQDDHTIVKAAIEHSPGAIVFASKRLQTIFNSNDDSLGDSLGETP